ncbi:MAG: hypothetical protein K5910_06585 [Bacteroidales bacterium]|nr:hypothetical protein [Bacteroidales bacterium]
MKPYVRYSIAGALIVLFCVLTLFLRASARQERQQVVCNEVQVGFTDSLRFVSEEDIRGYLDERYGPCIGQRLDSIALSRIEDLLSKRSAIERCEAWVTDDGILHVDVTQRAPLLRFQDGEKGFYVDERGYIFPLHESFTATVTTVEGAIPFSVPAGYKGEAPTEEGREWIAGVIAMDRFISASRTWKRDIRHIQVRSNGDVLLTLDGRPEQFLIGQPQDIPDKLVRIGRYLTLIAPNKPEGYYKTVNVKYNQQIICRQKDT